MRRKTKLIFSIFSLSLAMTFLVVGAYAAATARLATITGSVSFTSDHTYSTVTVSYVAAQAGEIKNTATGIDQGSIAFTETQQSPTNSIAVPNAAFTDTLVNFAIIVTIKNDFPDGGRSITVTAPAAPSNMHASITATRLTPVVTGGTMTGTTLPPQVTVKYVYTFVLNAKAASDFASTDAASKLSLQFSMQRI